MGNIHGGWRINKTSLKLPHPKSAHADNKGRAKHQGE